MLLPIPLLFNLLVSVLASAFFISAILLLYGSWKNFRRICSPRVVSDERVKVHGKGVGPTEGVGQTQGVLQTEVVRETKNPPRSQDAVADPAVWVPLVLGLALLAFIFVGRGRQVLGIAEFDTSYTNPVATTKDASLSRALQKPVAEPLLHAT